MTSVARLKIKFSASINKHQDDSIEQEQRQKALFITCYTLTKSA